MPERQDYVQRLLEELRQLLAEILRFRQAGSHDAALMTLLHAQERLFTRPASEFMGLPVEQQVRLLVIDETNANARDKCLAYATLLTEVGHTYRAKGLDAPAQGAYQLALQVTLLALLRPNAGRIVDFRDRIASLRRLVPGDALGPETAALLARCEPWLAASGDDAPPAREGTP